MVHGTPSSSFTSSLATMNATRHARGKGA